MDTKQSDGALLLESSFTKPVDSQTSSRLIALPAELRLKILRTLLKVGKMPNCNDLLSNYDKKKKEMTTSRTLERDDSPESRQLRDDALTAYNNAYSFSSQILRTCQTLYTEGSSVLYNENELAIVIDDGFQADWRTNRRGYAYSALDAAFNDAHSPSLYDDAPLIRDVVRYRPTSAEARAWFHEDHTDYYECAFLRFRKVEVHLRNANPYLFEVCRALRGLLLGKEVNLYFEDPCFHEDLASDDVALQLCSLSCQLNIGDPALAGLPSVQKALRICRSDIGVHDTNPLSEICDEMVLDLLSLTRMHEGVQSEWRRASKLSETYERPEEVHALIESVLQKVSIYLSEAKGISTKRRRKLKKMVAVTHEEYDTMKEASRVAYEAETAALRKSSR